MTIQVTLEWSRFTGGLLIPTYTLGHLPPVRLAHPQPISHSTHYKLTVEGRQATYPESVEEACDLLSEWLGVPVAPPEKELHTRRGHETGSK